MLFISQFVISVVLCILATYTDIKNKKIKNKHICIFLLFSIAIYGLFFSDVLAHWETFIINIFISFFVCFVMYLLKIWGAGDAKLFFVLAFMQPSFLIFENFIFPSIYILFFVFSLAYIYTIAESIIKYVKNKKEIKVEDKGKVEVCEKCDNSINVIDFCLSYITIWAFNTLIFMFEGILIPSVFNNNLFTFSFLNFLLLLIVVPKYNLLSFKYKIILGVVSVLFVVATYCVSWNDNSLALLVVSLVISFVLIVLNSHSSKYNYEEIKTEDVTAGMVLSNAQCVMFIPSRVKGLPTFSSETTDCRLSLEEADAVRRWDKSVNGKEIVVAVKLIPFAPFFLIGDILSWIFILYGVIK